MAIDERALMRMAARAGARGLGLVEPNPAVGCVIASPDGRVLGIGHHRRFGLAHAEVEAIAACRAGGHDPRGAVMVVTLEPCAHTGKTGPCTEAIIGAGIARVVYARTDPNPVAAGGARRLRERGVAAELGADVPEAFELGAPFAKRMATGLPWVIAKWAQTLDGRIATRTGASQWISCEASRRAVHRVRGSVDAIVTGVGTVLRDDPRLTARGVPIRRIARRVVIDSSLRTPPDGALFRTIADAPVVILTREESLVVHGDRAARLRDAGAEIIGVPGAPSGRVDLAAAMRALVHRFDATRVMVEAGPALVGGLLGGDLIDEVHAYIAPMVLGDACAPGPADVGVARALGDAARFRLRAVRRLADDVVIRYVRPVT